MTDTKPIKISDTLLVLLRFSKQGEYEASTIETIREVLCPLYNYKMTWQDIMRVMINSYVECINEPRFQAGNPEQATVLNKLLFAPLHIIPNKAYVFNSTEENEKVPVIDFYRSIIKEMMATFRYAKVDWCKDELNPFRVSNV